MQKQHWTFWRK